MESTDVMLNRYRAHKCISCGNDIFNNMMPCHARRTVCHKCYYSLRRKKPKPKSKYTTKR